MRKAVGLAALHRYDQKEAAGPRQCHADGDPMVQMPRSQSAPSSGWVMHPRPRACPSQALLVFDRVPPFIPGSSYETS